MKFIADTLVKLALLSVVYWLYIYHTSPLDVCSMHPDKDKHDDYYLCEPFGIEFKQSAFPSKAGRIREAKLSGKVTQILGGK